jgi:dUTP pyrophosphatase
MHPRSGLSVRVGLGMVNAPGTIDAGYRGEISVNLINHDRENPIELSRGDRIAQLIVQRVCYATLIEVAGLPGSDRGEQGFGSSGLRSD